MSFDDRVRLTRVRLFFDHAAGNTARAGVGAAMTAIVLWMAGVSPLTLGLWFGAIMLIAALTVALERSFRRSELTLANAEPWVHRRIALGGMIGLLFGLVVFLLPLGASYEFVSFVFVANLTMVAIAAITYPVMPRYYMILNATAMVPMMVYFLIRFDTFGQILLAATVAWQFIFLRKALLVSRSSIEGLITNEKLTDEIAEHRRAREQIHYLAFHDVLTGLANRRQFQDSASHAIKVAARGGARVGVAVIDLDHFKPINDTHGHQTGDHVLQEVADRLRHSTRESDLVARLGGDEFGVLLENVTHPADVGEIARKIAKHLNAPLVEGSATIPLHASIGFAVFPSDGNDLETVLRIADERMYAQKRGRSNGVTLH